jgi:hypothetical protein
MPHRNNKKANGCMPFLSFIGGGSRSPSPPMDFHMASTKHGSFEGPLPIPVHPGVRRASLDSQSSTRKSSSSSNLPEKPQINFRTSPPRPRRSSLSTPPTDTACYMTKKREADERGFIDRAFESAFTFDVNDEWF